MADGAAPRRSLLVRAAAPGLIVLACVLAAPHIVRNPELLSRLQGAGPTFWPNLMLLGTGLCAAAWLGLEVWRSVRHPAAADELVPPLASDSGPYDLKRAVAGIVLTLLYGAALPLLGFPIATALFMGTWLLLGRVHSPTLLATVPILGTLVLCYVFVLLARMPLERGAGAVGEFTIGLYQLLGIY